MAPPHSATKYARLTLRLTLTPQEGMSVGYVGTDRVTSGRDTAMGGGQLNISGQVAREGMSVGYVGKARVMSGRVTGMGGKTQASTEKGRLDKSGQGT